MREHEYASRFPALPDHAEEIVPPPKPNPATPKMFVDEDRNEIEIGMDNDTTNHLDTRECDFDAGPTPLYSAIQKRDWEVAMKLAQDSPLEAMTWVSRKEKDGHSIRWRLLPLHSAIIFRAPASVVETLLCAFPRGAQCKDDQGMLPIHLAFRHGSTEDVVNLLLVAFPKSTDVKDNKGRIPLDLAQASASTNKDAFVKALQRGPTYYAVAAAATERAAVTAEQRAIFDAKLNEVRNNHHHEMQALKSEYQVFRMDHEVQIAELEEELGKTQETSQVLVDHVSSLEAQLSSRGETERFLACKIATLDTSLKETSQTKESIRSEMKADLERVTAENEELKNAMETMKTEESDEKEKLRVIENQLATALVESQEKEKRQAETIQLLEADLIESRAKTANAEAQLKSKILVEETLAAQVSTLASRLAESAADTGNATVTYSQRIKLLEKERSVLRSTIKDLAGKLEDVAGCLDVMTVEQEKIVKATAHNEETTKQAATVHSEILANAHRQRELYEVAEKERTEIIQVLERQEEASFTCKEDTDKLMEKVIALDEELEGSHKDREDLLCSVVKQRLEMRDMMKSSLSVVPKVNLDDNAFIDSVVEAVQEQKKEEDTKEETPEVKKADTKAEQVLPAETSEEAAEVKKADTETEQALTAETSVKQDEPPHVREDASVEQPTHVKEDVSPGTTSESTVEKEAVPLDEKLADEAKGTPQNNKDRVLAARSFE